MKKVFSLIVCLFCLNALNAQQQKIYYVGHSLTNLNIPFMVQQMAQAASKPADYRHHINIGAPLSLQWSEPWKFNGDLHWVASLGRDVEYGSDFLVELGRGGYTALVLTEAQGFQSNLYWNDGIGHGRKFDSVARRASPNVKTYCYETWSHVVNNDYAAWRLRINDDRPFWEKMAGGIRPDSLIVPAGQAMAALYDALLRGSVGRLTNINQIFTDEIHLNNTGNYFIALVMYATLFKSSPEGLPDVLSGPFQQTVRVETDAVTRLALQRLAWQVVRNYRFTGISTPTAELVENKVILYPNPTNGYVFLKNTEGVQSIELCDMQGRLIKTCVVQPVLDISDLPKGMYLFFITNREKRYAVKLTKV
jgi:hypothetical protein